MPKFEIEDKRKRAIKPLDQLSALKKMHLEVHLVNEGAKEKAPATVKDKKADIQPAPAPAAAQVWKYTDGSEIECKKNTVEIRFASKPSKEAIKKLEFSAFVPDSKSMVWQAARNQWTENQARQILGADRDLVATGKEKETATKQPQAPAMSKEQQLHKQALDDLGWDGLPVDYGKLIASPKKDGTIERPVSNLHDSMQDVQAIVKKYHKEVAKLAEKMDGKTVKDTARNIWQFLQPIKKGGQINYRKEPKGIEIFRTPSRAWKDRIKGIDCDCSAIFIASILKCLGYKRVNFVLAAFDSGLFSHIYVTVGGLPIDPLVKFGTEAQGITKKKSYPIV